MTYIYMPSISDESEFNIASRINEYEINVDIAIIRKPDAMVEITPVIDLTNSQLIKLDQAMISLGYSRA